MASSGSGGSGSSYIQMWGSDNTSSSEATAKNVLHTGGDSYFNGGNVGIGTTTPIARLQIDGGVDNTDGRCLVLTNKNSSYYPNYYGYIAYGGSHYDTYYHTSFNNYASTSNGARMFINYYSGGGLTANSTNLTSDDRIKHNEKEIKNSISTIRKLKPVRYFKSTKMYDEDHNYDLDLSGNPITDDTYIDEMGFIAQRVLEIPELKFSVEKKDDDTFLNNVIDESGNPLLDNSGNNITELEHRKGKYLLNYQNIFVLGIKGIQELDKLVQELKAELQSIKTQLNLN